LTHNRIKNSNFINELKKSMAKNINIQVTDNLTDNFRGYAALLRKIKQRVLIAQQRVIYAANEEMLRMYWDVGEMLQQSQDADGWGKKTLQRLAVDLKNDYSEIKGFTVRNMQYMVQSITNHWTTRYLQEAIKLDDYGKHGALANNFTEPLPVPEANDVKSMLKDPYIFDMLTFKSKDRIKAEYALRDIQKPIGISDYELGQALPKDFRGSLPTIEEIEKELESNRE
jgi:hypothetical protein